MWDEEVRYFTSYLNTNCTPGSGKTDELQSEISTEENLDFKVYPNPNNGSAFITLNKNNFEQAKLSILDINGIIVFQKDIIADGNPIICDVKQPGVYIVKVDQGESSIRKNLLVIK